MTCPRCKQERIVFTFDAAGKLICLRCADVAKLATIREFTRRETARVELHAPTAAIMT